MPEGTSDATLYLFVVGLCKYLYLSSRLGQTDQASKEQRLRSLGSDFDIRDQALWGDAQKSAMAKALTAERRTSIEQYQATAGSPGLAEAEIRFNRFGLPQGVTNEHRALSAALPGSSEDVARYFLRDQGRFFLLSEQVLSDMRLVSTGVTGAGSVLRFKQTLDGIDVFQATVTVVLNSAGEVIYAGVGELVSDLDVTAVPSLTPEEAAKAALVLTGGESIEVLEVVPPLAAQRTHFRNPAGNQFNPIRVELSWLPMSPTEVRLAYRIYLELSGTEAYEMLIDAQDGGLLFRHSLIQWMAQARVWEKSPLEGERELVDFADGWLPLDGTQTTGNNIDAYLDTDGNNAPDDRQTSEIKDGRAFSESQVFDFPFGDGTTGDDPRDFQAAAVTNAFYVTNAAHDFFHDLGFDEEAGNFQTDNFGLGGLDGDPMRVEVHDGLIENNASFQRAPDGMPGRLQLGVFTFFNDDPNDDRDSAYSAQVIIHEYTHGVTTRLANGPDDVSCLRGFHSGGMGEGWSDYFGNSLSTQSRMILFPAK